MKKLQSVVIQARDKERKGETPTASPAQANLSAPKLDTAASTSPADPSAESLSVASPMKDDELNRSMLGPADLEKRLEALKVREQKAVKKDKELGQRSLDLDRRAKLIEEVEEKQGTVAAREAQCELKDKEVQAMLRDIKKRDKAVKDAEQALSEKENQLFGKEVFLNSQEKELATKLAAVDTREKSLFDRQFAVEEGERRLNEKRKVVQQEDEETKVRRKQVVEHEELLKGRLEKVAVEEVRLQKWSTELAEKETEVNKTASLNATRQKEMSQKENELNRERERLNRKSAELDEFQEKLNSDNRTLALKKEEIARRVAHVQEEEQEVRRKTSECKSMAAETVKRRDQVEKHVLENRRYEAELNTLRNDLKQMEAELRGRERRVAVQQRDQSDREQQLIAQEEASRTKSEELREKEAEIEVSRAEVSQREAAVEQLRTELIAQQERCASREAQVAHRQTQLDKTERDLVDWMKEMEWREMMLGEREALVDREPVTLPKTAVGQSSTGFSNKAFGHAIVEVQLRRLKDQYISAQMKHARAEAQTGKSVYTNHKRLPRFGIAPNESSGDVADDVARASTIYDARQKVHSLGVHFKTLMSKIRAFDSFEDAASQEKVEQLSHFDPDERTVLTMTANLEYTLKVHEDLLVALQTSPLDEKDKAVNVQDLVNRITKWWGKTEERVRSNLMQLLNDRERYLKHSIAILTSKAEVLPQLANTSMNSHTHSLPSTGEPYKGQTAFEHVKESKVLAPRGLATLKAVSEMAQTAEGNPSGAGLAESRRSKSKSVANDGSRTPEQQRTGAKSPETSSGLGQGGHTAPPAMRSKTADGNEGNLGSGLCVDMTAPPKDRVDVEWAVMMAGRTRSSAARRKEKPFDLRQLTLTRRDPPSPYEARNGGIRLPPNLSGRPESAGA